MTALPSRPPIRVTLDEEGAPRLVRTFTTRFTIGRDPDSGVPVQSRAVSRRHAEVVYEGGRWWFRDLRSANGSFVDGARVDRVEITGTVRVRLGNPGPTIALETAAEDRTETPSRFGRRKLDPETEAAIRKYLDAHPDAGAGDHTMMVRRALTVVQKRQRARYGWVIAAVAAFALAVSGYAFWQYQAMQRQIAAAGLLFDEIRGLDVQIAQFRDAIEQEKSTRLAAELAKLEESRQRMIARYEGYIQELGIYRRLDAQEQIVLRIARAFNESEAALPAGFVDAVRRTIRDYWQTDDGRARLATALRRGEREGYTRRIVQTLVQHKLPPQFFWVAVQESTLDPLAIGPETRWGRAKGMWQFVPETARRFGLDPGPDADLDQVDIHDERHDVAKATDAAARYLTTIYRTLAQASGLLVVASYNWGEHRVVRKLGDLPGPQAIPAEALEGIPENPAHRSYWRFLTEYRDRMPEETKDYVLKIFAAAVIGEDPKLFGFDFDTPLARHLAPVKPAAKKPRR